MKVMQEDVTSSEVLDTLIGSLTGDRNKQLAADNNAKAHQVTFTIETVQRCIVKGSKSLSAHPIPAGRPSAAETAKAVVS